MSFIDMRTMPILQFFNYLRINITIFIKEIPPFIKINNHMKQMINT